MAWKWYVYEIMRDGCVIYVGKGCRGRSRDSAKRLNGQPIIIAHFLHEEHALSFERGRIGQRIEEGCKLFNISFGNYVAWERRTDARQMATDGLREMARRAGNWIKVGRLGELSRRSGLPIGQLFNLYQQYGV